jgi:acetyltransferase-like isoleucine patch superfamily enzyme
MLSKKKALQRPEYQRFRSWLTAEDPDPVFFAPHVQGEPTCILFPGFLAHIKHHLSYFAMWSISQLPWSGIKITLFRMMGVRIGKNVHISACVFLDGVFPRLIELKDGCMLGAGSKILTHENTTQGFRVGRVSVGHDSVVGAFSIVRSGVTLGNNVTTGIGSIVLKDIPDDRVAIGNPARIVKPTCPQERP